MRIGIITGDVPPYTCGIGDHSIMLAKAIRLTGEDAVIIAKRGKPSESINVLQYHWCEYQNIEKLYQKLRSFNLDHLILQFTPLMYVCEHRDGNHMVKFWEKCSQHWKISIIVHETYFRVWWYPRSWVNSLVEKRLLHRMVELSHFAFSASQPLVKEMACWRKVSNVQLLPIGSNFPLVRDGRDAIRVKQGVASDEIVLVLFGGGNTLKWMRSHVDVTDALLAENGIRARWLLLGSVRADWFRLHSKPIAPGRLPERQISELLLAADIFLMPHYAGLCGKRGTLIAAMQHSLPVVGTRTEMTDSFWDHIEGVKLIPRGDARAFARQVSALACDGALREAMGESNRLCFRNRFTWPVIAQDILDKIGR